MEKDISRIDSNIICLTIPRGKGNIQFCRISRGSLHELKDQLICSLDDGFIRTEEYGEGMELIDRAIALVNGYINYLGKRRRNIEIDDE